MWTEVAAERIALADLLEGTDAWDAPSRCSGWTVKDVVAHLVILAEGTVASIFLGGLRVDLRPNVSVDKRARRLAASTTGMALAARLRAAADGRFVVPGMPVAVALGEVLVHRADIADAAGLPRHAADESMRAVLDAERRLWFAFGVPRRVRALRFRPTDGDWTVGPAGGPSVEGPGEQLLLAVAGRPGATAGLTGDGVPLLA